MRQEQAAGGAGLIYCGLCGALNPAGNHFCAACGTTLVDAFHATEGLRVYDRPDPAARLIEIVAAGRELDVVEDAAASADYARVRLDSGRLGYVRLDDVAAAAPAGGATAVAPPDINTNARGCVGPTAALAALALVVVTGSVGLVFLVGADRSDAGPLTLFFCLIIGPLLLLTGGLYVAARARDEQEEEGRG